MTDSPRLLADIGGTYARFTLETAPGRFEHAATLRCADHADFHAAVSAYLKTLAADRIAHAAVAIANPVEGDEVRMTNYHWQFSIEASCQPLARRVRRPIPQGDRGPAWERPGARPAPLRSKRHVSITCSCRGP